MAEDEPYPPVGAIVFSAHCKEHYTVLSHNEDGSVTVRWLGDGPDTTIHEPRTLVHTTPLDPRDVVVGIRERLTLCSREHRTALARRVGVIG